jgi:hypothetical protein
MTDRDPSPSEILADMLMEAGDDAEGEWRVRIPTPLSFAARVEMTRQGLAAVRDDQGQTREAQALSGLLTAVLERHERGLCECPRRVGRQDPICGYAQALATVLASG